MILSSLVLQDFGLYEGRHCYDLRPDPETGRPVIVIKGHNGGGKTTFLDAVRLALYGRRALGPRVSRVQYEDYLADRVHRYATMRKASVQLSFTRQEDGRLHEYSVLRSWIVNPSGVVDTLLIERDGNRLGGIPEEDWEHYLQDMIPPGVSQLFFFDGEKIQEIADTEATEGLKDAIRALLGLDLIEQLRDDLSVYAARAQQTDLADQFDRLDNEIRELKEALASAEEAAAILSSERDIGARRIDRAQKAFEAEGGALALDRTKLRERLAAEEKRIDSLVNQLRRLANSPACFALAPKLMKRLKKRISEQQDVISQISVSIFLSRFEDAMKVRDSKEPSWTKGHFKALQGFLDGQIEAQSESLLEADPDWMIERLHLLDASVRSEACTLAADLLNAQEERDRLKTAIKGFDEKAAHDALGSLREAEHALGAVEAELNARNKEIDQYRYRLTTTRKMREKLIAATNERELQKERVGLAERSREALEVYGQRVLKKRLHDLSQNFVICFNGLIRKRRLVERVSINPETFEIRLHGESGAEISKDTLSAGERQIFAISMLWALGKTSGRDLPVIIDTPLSRLDRHHRRALMADYATQASEQVIILCTDTELTGDLEEIIEPYVARQYEIGVGENSQSTLISVRGAECPEVAVYAH